MNNSFSELLEHKSSLTLIPLQVYLSFLTEAWEFLEGKNTCFRHPSMLSYLAGSRHMINSYYTDIWPGMYCHPRSAIPFVPRSQTTLPWILSATANLVVSHFFEISMQFLSSWPAVCGFPAWGTFTLPSHLVAPFYPLVLSSNSSFLGRLVLALLTQ